MDDEWLENFELLKKHHKEFGTFTVKPTHGDDVYPVCVQYQSSANGPTFLTVATAHNMLSVFVISLKT